MATASRARRRLLLTIVLTALSGCSLMAPRVPRPGAALIGTPYEFGGADVGGFDCSGLALYVYERAGISIPRTAAEQQRAAQVVPLSALAPGDLVFFRMGAHRIDHVGIYIGAGRFVHAPHQGVAVSSAELVNGYYARHLVSAGRFVSSAMSSR
jgi:cell wall-associated NlpC family hydrolase